MELRQAGKSFREIGNYFGVSDERARQLVKEGERIRSQSAEKSQPVPPG